MDTDKIKAFFIQHVEKMIFAVVIAASVALLYFGMQLPNYLDKQKPDSLRSEATQVRNDIDVNHNDAIIPERIPSFDIVEETKKLYTAVKPTAYSLPRTWEGKDLKDIVRREDPDLYAPRAVRVMSVATSIAVRGGRDDPAGYPLAALEPADPLEKVEKKVREPRRSRRSRGNMDDMMGGMMEMEMGMDEMEDEFSMEADMMSEMGGEEGSMGAGRKFNSAYDFGMRPQMTEDKQHPIPEVGWFIAGTAVVPHKENYESFEHALASASGYDPRRDTPFYYDLQIQRADVTDKSIDELTDADWENRWDRLIMTRFAALKWSGFAPEIVPKDYREDALSLWIPPVLLDDYRDFSTHPMIPMVSQDELERLANADEQEDDIIEFSVDMDADLALVAPGERSSGMAGMMGDDMDMMDMEMSMGMDMEMGGMMMGMGMAMMGRGVEENPVDYKLIRFYDFYGYRGSPVPGRKYVYRVRYGVNDPNFPFMNTLQPKINTLTPEVAKRVQGLMAKARAENKRSFTRWSEWSAPSEPVSLGSLERVYAGPVKRGTVNVWPVGGKSVEVARDAPTAKILASQFDMTLGTRVPLELEVTEGSVLSAKADHADVVDPITLEVKKLPDAELVSGTTVVDISGAGPLKIADDKEITEPGFMLLFDPADGALKVTHDIKDQEYFRIYTYADERGL